MLLIRVSQVQMSIVGAKQLRQMRTAGVNKSKTNTVSKIKNHREVLGAYSKLERGKKGISPFYAAVAMAEQGTV